MATKLVDPAIVCGWLGIPPDQWPPDHYTLLGLRPGEPDAEKIERQVQQRLELVRRYQLASPDAATEAMNRIAQAFCCLTDPQARRGYDQALFGDSPPAPAPPVETASAAPPAAETAPEAESLPLEEEQAPPVNDIPPESPPPAELPPPPQEVEYAPEKGRRGLGTRRAIYERIVRTRALLELWERAGRYLGQPKRRLARPSEARELIDVLTAIRDEVKDFPPLVGEAGQPGYLVITLARQPAIVPTFQTLLPGQRDALARDWSAGQKALQAHKDYLRHESRSLRRKTIFYQLFRAARTFLNENPAGWLIVLGLVAIIVALVRGQLVD